jgi:Fe-S cluster assembly iron-binding protein IscA
MRLNFTLILLLLLSFTANAQKLTGIWRGYFSSTTSLYRGGEREETYKYEIQIDQQSNNGIKGVTYSYKSTVFYGKAELQGIFTNGTGSLLIKETKLVDLKIGDKSEPCLMTCYLDYTRIGKMEVLEGTFISINPKDKSDCGSGKVYLERVTTSDFKKEDFLVKKKTDTPKSTKTNPPVLPPVTAENKTKNSKDNLLTRPIVRPPVTQQKTTSIPKNNVAGNKKPDQKAIVKPKPLPKKDDKPVTVNNKPTERIDEQPVNSKKQEKTDIPEPQQKVPLQNILVPRVLIERENNLVRTITTSEEELQVEFYDGGDIDNDTITVYHNNDMVISHGRLSLRPLIVKIKSSKTDNHHELIMVAENLGDIPPNTATMIIKSKSGKDRYEINLESTERRNAKVIINYVPKE